MEEELAKIETLRQHVLGALGITSADEVPEDLFPLFGKSSLVRFGRAKRWKYKRATKMFVEMLCWYTAPMTCRDRSGSGKTSTARATSAGSSKSTCR